MKHFLCLIKQKKLDSKCLKNVKNHFQTLFEHLIYYNRLNSKILYYNYIIWVYRIYIILELFEIYNNVTITVSACSNFDGLLIKYFTFVSLDPFLETLMVTALNKYGSICMNARSSSSKIDNYYYISRYILVLYSYNK